jgi:hypothetical protein
MQRSAVVLGVPVEPGQRLAGGRAPERQLTVMVGRGTSITTLDSLL